MRITIRAFGKLLDVLDRKFELELDDVVTIKTLLSTLSERKKQVLQPLLYDPTLTILVNGRNIHSLNGYETLLQDGNTVALIPFVVGG